MIECNVDSFYVGIEVREILQDYVNHEGKKLSRFIKKTDVKVGVFGRDYSSSAFGFISFVSSALKTFSQNKFGKQIHQMELIADNHGASLGKSHKEILEVRKKENNNDFFLVLDLVNEDGQVIDTQALTYRACEQLREVIAKAFGYLSPDQYMSEEEIRERRKEEEWSSLSDDMKKDRIRFYLNLRKMGAFKDGATISIIPIKILKEI